MAYYKRNKYALYMLIVDLGWWKFDRNQSTFHPLLSLLKAWVWVGSKEIP